MLSPTSEDDATCCLSASGSCLVSTGSEGVRMWDLRHTQRALAEFSDESDQVSAVAVSGGRLCTGSDVGAVRVCEQFRWD